MELTSNTSLPLLFFSSPFLSVPPPHCLYTHSLIRHLSHWYDGPGQHCDMLRRQYKYLISPNGNRHSVLIAPHIIWGAVSAADIPFDPPSICPSPLPLTLCPSLSASLSFVYAVYFGSYVIIWPHHPTPAPSCLFLSLDSLVVIFLSTHIDVSVCLLSPPHWLYLCLSYCMVSSVALFPSMK